MQSLKKVLVFIFTSSLFISHAQNNGGVGIGTTSPDASSVLHIESTDKGVLIPRMDSVQRMAISSPATGLMVYQTNGTSGFWYYNGIAWQNFESDDNQTLSISGDSISISNGNTIVLPDYVKDGLLLTDSCINTFTLFTQSVVEYSQGLFPFLNDWQSFTVSGNSGYLGRANVYFNGAFAGGSFNVYSGSGVGGTLLHTQSISALPSGLQSIDIPANTVPLTVGNVYTIELVSSSTFIWGGDDDNTYPGGTAKPGGDILDHYFQLYFVECNLEYVIEPNTANGSVNLSNIDTINFANGHTFTGSSLMDDDLDTKIELEQHEDEDTIRISVDGTETYVMDRGHFQIMNTNNNIYIGENAGKKDTIKRQGPGHPDNNIAIGTNALLSHFNSGSDDHVAIGSNALKNLQGTGVSANYSNTSIGSFSLGNLKKGSYNTAVGERAGQYLGYGSRNTVIGSQAGPNSVSDLDSTYTNTTAIGAFAEITQDSTVILGNAADVGIGTTAPDAKLHVVGNILMEDGNQQPGYVMTSDSAGRGSWQPINGGDDQTLSISGDTLFIEDGNKVVLPNTFASQGLTTDQPCDTTGTLDASNESSNFTGSPIGDSFWQEVIPTSTGLLTGIELYFVGSFGGTLSVYDGQGTSGNLLTTVIVGSTGTGWQRIDIVDPVLINVGNSFTFHLTSSYVRVPANPNGTYAGASSWVFDVFFRTYINSCDYTPDYVISSPTTDGTINLANVDTVFFSDNTYQLTAATDDQTLSLSGNTLSIEDGNSITLPVGSALQDADADTKIQVEESTDEDIIRFDIAGSEKLVLKENTSGIMQMEINNNENNILLGGGAGTNVSGTNGRNTLVGYFAGNLLSSGATNAFFGNGAGNQVTTGSSNTFIGSLAGGGNNGSTNVFIGKQAGYLNANGNNNTIVGYLAGSGSTGSNNVFLGSRAGSNSTKSNALYIDNTSTGSPLIYGEFDNNFLEVNGTLQVEGTLQVKNAYSFPISDGTANQILQTDGSGNLTWQTNTGVVQTLIEDTDNDTKIQVEESVDEDIIRFDINNQESLIIKQNPSGYALFETYNLNASTTTLFGTGAGEGLTTGNTSTFLGYEAGTATTIGQANTFLGAYSGTDNIGGTNNVFVGRDAGKRNISGIENTYLGRSAGLTSTGSGNVFLGYRAGYNETGSNKLYIENSVSSSPLIYGEFDNNLVRVNGTLNINNAFSFPMADGTANQILKTDGSGNVTWGNDFPSTLSYSFPVADGTANQVLKTDGAGNVSWGNDFPSTLSYSFPMTDGTANQILQTDGSGNVTWGNSPDAILNTSPSGNEVGGQNANIDIQGTLETGKLRTFQDVTLGSFNDPSPHTVTINSNLKVGETGTVISSIIKVSVNKDVPNVSSNSTEWVTFTVTGAQIGGVVSISPSSALDGQMIIAQAYVSASDTVIVNFRNVGGSGSNPPAMDYYISVIQ